MEVQEGLESETIDEELTERVATELYSVICKNGGIMEVPKAASALSTEGMAYMMESGIYPLLMSFGDVLKLEVEQPSNRARLKAVVKVELCTDYKKSNCGSADCPRLHVCPFFIRGNCRFGERCRYRHDFEDVHEQEILIKHKLNGLEHASLVALLRRVLFGCRPHARAVFAGMLAARFFACANAIVGPRPKQPTVDEICGFHIKGICGYGNHCNRHRHKLPYLWQIMVPMQDGAEKWANFESSYNQQIERDFCDVNKDSSIEINIANETDEEQGMVLIVYFADMVAKDDSGESLSNVCMQAALKSLTWVL